MPALASRKAARDPTGPAPTTTTRSCFVMRLSLAAWSGGEVLPHIIASLLRIQMELCCPSGPHTTSLSLTAGNTREDDPVTSKTRRTARLPVEQNAALARQGIMGRRPMANSKSRDGTGAQQVGRRRFMAGAAVAGVGMSVAGIAPAQEAAKPAAPAKSGIPIETAAAEHHPPAHVDQLTT